MKILHKIIERKSDEEKYKIANELFDKNKKKIINFFTQIDEKTLRIDMNDYKSVIFKTTNQYIKYSEILGDIIFKRDISNINGVFSPSVYNLNIYIYTTTKISEIRNEFINKYKENIKELDLKLNNKQILELTQYKPFVLASKLYSKYNIEISDDEFETLKSTFKTFEIEITKTVDIDIRNTFVHEFIHLLDHINIDGKDSKYSDYYNSGTEKNAYLIGIMSEMDLSLDFKEILKSKRVTPYLNKLTPKNRKSVVNRMYDIWYSANNKVEEK